ncbi:MAG: peptide deformylase [Deltaproteobacteria bacterium]|nr:peptide deformylase [Deltaproteobacteria bacterium]MCX7953133.1 peptide deformylase [Deltaproteobacteria bacterium]
MAVRQLVLYPEPILRKVSKEVNSLNEEIFTLVADLKETLLAEQGLGLAAPQIGVAKRVFVFRRKLIDGEIVQEVINPVLELRGRTIDSEEGCLSIPDFREVIKRRSVAVLRGIDLNGNDILLELEGLEARCAQHELDHLNGVLFIDHFTIPQKLLFNEWVEKQEWFKLKNK